MERTTKILLDGRRNGAKRSYVAVDFDIELGLLRTGNEKDEELALRYVWTPALASTWSGPPRHQQIDVVQYYARI